MFKNISWPSFITAIAVLVIVYYIIIGFLYFRADILRLFREGINRKPLKSPLANTGLSNLTEKQAKGDPSLFNQVHELMEELKELFFNAAAQSYPKEELLTALQSKLKQYSHLKDTPFQAAISNQISQTASYVCHETFDDTDIRRLW